jgi:hypothetical protein
MTLRSTSRASISARCVQPKSSPTAMHKVHGNDQSQGEQTSRRNLALPIGDRR